MIGTKDVQIVVPDPECFKNQEFSIIVELSRVQDMEVKSC